MIHHVLIEVTDLERSGAFYDAVLAPIGWRRHMDSSLQGIGWGIRRPLFFINESKTARSGSGSVCFGTPGIAAVKAAWEAGVAAGGADDGKPSARPQYGAAYYSANLLDPDGHRLEFAIAPD